MKEEIFMREAIVDAKKNKHHFGAVVVRNRKTNRKGIERTKNRN